MKMNVCMTIKIANYEFSQSSHNKGRIGDNTLRLRINRLRDLYNAFDDELAVPNPIHTLIRIFRNEFTHLQAVLKTN